MGPEDRKDLDKETWKWRGEVVPGRGNRLMENRNGRDGACLGPRKWSVLAVKWEVEVRAATLGWGHAMQGLKCPREESVVKRKGQQGATDSSEQETVVIRVTWQRYALGLGQDDAEAVWGE